MIYFLQEQFMHGVVLVKTATIAGLVDWNP